MSTLIPKFKQTGTGAVNRPINLKLAEQVSIQDFGAVGDGVTDDTAAIQAAITSSRHVVVPAGMTCLISSTIVIPDASNLLEFMGGYGQLGAYPGSYFIKKSTMTTPAITVGYSGTIIGGGVVGQVGNTGDGIQLVSGKGTLTHVYVTGAGNDGIRVGLDTSGGNCNSFYIENCVSQYNGRHGFYIHDNTFNVANANAGSLIQPGAYLNSGDGIKLGHCFWVTVSNGLAEENTGYGLNLSGTDNNSYPECRWATILGGDYNEGNTAGIINDDSYFSSFFGLDFNTIPPASTSVLQGAGKRIFIGSGLTSVQSVTFPSSPTASADVNTMDYYEEGTFTPAIIGSTSAGTATYAALKGRFTRLGNVVTFVIAINYSAGTGTGNLQLTGLPFTSLNDSSLFQSVNIGPFSNLTTPASTIPTGVILPNTKTIAFYSSVVGGGAMALLAYDAAAELYISGSYFV
jgi:hypothetical protein